ncbi:hypothetical protein BY996DRAFT_6990899 [Phakopsora pachyrhizi]|uniref:Uncharacterized protein n=1 Tax=Phakopsora pachyrhizi TaxID=170000 RepID=A0AAV0B6T3_PHAPC|nr:hypothetical protein BY996DRAFT_6990899 [Phakopsora pachyrhizi]CAH7681493.1 hypothetical protein PPACK8108_LOCUS14098 [Phakopsora pachyrhizi]
MPHKRAKASVRKEKSISVGNDLPPDQQINQTRKRSKGDGSKSNGQLPKNMYRILNAEKIRAEYRNRKLNRSGRSSNVRQDGHGGIKDKTEKTRGELEIKPDEKLYDFNQRVEVALRPELSAAMKTARKRSTNQPSSVVPSHRRDQKKQGTIDHEVKSEEEEKRPKEFEPRPTKFPLSSVATEPPTIKLKHLSSSSKFKSKKTPNSICPAPISSAQRRLLAEEREKVIDKYRRMKEEKNAP